MEKRNIIIRKSYKDFCYYFIYIGFIIYVYLNMSLFIESSFILPKGIIDSYIKFKTWNSCSYSDKEKKASQANIWTPVFSTRFAIPIIGIIYALLWVSFMKFIIRTICVFV